MCQYLEWELNVDPATLTEFEEMVHKDFAGIGPYPTYILPSTKKSPPPPSVIPFHPTCGVSPSPSNEQRYTSPPKVPYVPSPPSYTLPPETPSPSYLISSPASSVSPLTPAGIEDLLAKIVLALSSPGYPKPLEHIQPPASKSKMFTFTSPCVVVHVHSFAFRIHSLLDERSTYRIQRRHRSGQHTRFMDAMYTPSSLSYLGWSQASIGIRCSLLHMLVSPSASTFFFFFASFAYRTCITVIIIIVVFHTSIACHWAPICTTCKESKKCSNNDNNCA